MDDDRRQYLVYLAGALVLVSAAVHLAIGIAEVLNALAGVGEAQLALGVAYLLAAALLYLLVAAYQTDRIAPGHAYAVGAGLMVVYLLAYTDWHVFNLAETALPLEVIGLEHGQSHHHDHGHAHHDHGHHGHSHAPEADGAVASLVDHLRDDPFALVSKTAELVGAVVLAVLAIAARD